jgi:hypothetical protein
MEPTFTYILSWPPDQYRRGKIQIISCYGDTTDTGWTTGGYATTSMPGRGHHIFNFINQRYYYDSHLGWGWYYDSNPNIERKVLVNNQVLNLGSILGSTMGTIDTPLLKMESFICDSGFVKMEVLPTRWAECEQIGWFPTDPISLRITQGEEFATIFNIRTETDLGNTALIDPFVRIEDLSFFFRPNWDQDGLDDIVIMPIDSNFTLPFTVVVEASINEVTFSNEIEFIPKSLIIETGVYPEVTTTGEQSYLDIYISGLCSWLSFETKINVEIISGQEYGNLIDPYSGDKTKNINNLEHWFGFAYLDYIADGISPNLADTVIFRISTTDPDIVPKEVTLVIKPSPIYVYTIPETIGADDIADVIIQHRLEDGTLEDFPPDQTFELAVLDGCINGNFMVGDSINVYFEDALQPIKFVTSDTLDSEVKNILIRVGTNLDEGGGGGISRPIGNLCGEEIKAVDTLRVGFEKMMAEKRAAAEKKENNEPPIEAPIVKQCALDEPTYTTYWKGFTSVGDDCDEEIVVCNNYQQPKFEDVGTITVLGENDLWQWTDSQGIQQTTNTGNACNFKPQLGEFGKTYIMPKIGDFAPDNLVYSLLDDTRVTVCQDKNNLTDPIWRYSVENLRVPIFRDHCPAWAINNDYVDLLDGTNADTLAKYINNCADYTKVMVALEWWWIGPYRQQGQDPPYKFYFSTGVIAHENIHVKQMKDGGTKYFPVGSIYKEMNNGSKGFRALALYKYSAILAKCPEDALAAVQGTETMEERVKIQLDAALTIANDLVSLIGQDNQGRDKSELEADELARPKYDEIRTNLKNWAKQQSWWCIPWPIVGDDYYRGCDRSDCKH